MSIDGSVDDGGDSVLLYKDNTSLTSCSEYRSYGDNVCDDVILVPVTSTTHVQNVSITTATYVVTCEVQIIARKTKCFCKMFILSQL